MYLILLLLFIFSTFFEVTIYPIPITFVWLLCYCIVFRSRKIFGLSFVVGLFLDILNVRTLGSTSLFFLTVFALVLLYQNKYEIRSYPFVIVSAFVGSFLYLEIFGNASFVQAGICSLVAVGLFAIASQKLKISSEAGRQN